MRLSNSSQQCFNNSRVLPGGNRSTIHGAVRLAIKAEPNTLNPVISGLVQEGYVSETRGPRNARLLLSVLACREADPVPTPSLNGDRDPVPTPSQELWLNQA